MMRTIQTRSKKATDESAFVFNSTAKSPIWALMRVVAHHKTLGDMVTLRVAGNATAIERHFGEEPEHVYASAIFTRTRALW